MASHVPRESCVLYLLGIDRVERGRGRGKEERGGGCGWVSMGSEVQRVWSYLPSWGMAASHFHFGEFRVPNLLGIDSIREREREIREERRGWVSICDKVQKKLSYLPSWGMAASHIHFGEFRVPYLFRMESVREREKRGGMVSYFGRVKNKCYSPETGDCLRRVVLCG